MAPKTLLPPVDTPPAMMSQPRPGAGRPAVAPDLFAAMLVSRLGGITERHAKRLLSVDPSELPARLWRVVALAVAQGCRTRADFEDILNEHLGPA
jgi:hypothetical protein